MADNAPKQPQVILGQGKKLADDLRRVRLAAPKDEVRSYLNTVAIAPSLIAGQGYDLVATDAHQLIVYGQPHEDHEDYALMDHPNLASLIKAISPIRGQVALTLDKEMFTWAVHTRENDLFNSGGREVETGLLRNLTYPLSLIHI